MVKLYKLSTKNLCILTIDTKSARVDRSRAAKKERGGISPPPAFITKKCEDFSEP